jgi:hypothetical protein
MKHKQRIIRIALTLILALIFGASGASALEAPVGVTEVSIPVSLSVGGAIAGGEIAFNESSGLEYLRFVPASGIENKVETTLSGAHYVGFFADDNDYAPKDGKVALGNLVFKYSGTDPEKITFSEIRLHTKNGADVDTEVLKTSTIVNISRQSGGGGGNENNDDNGSGNQNGNGSEGTGTENAGSGTSRGSSASSGNGEESSGSTVNSEAVTLPGENADGVDAGSNDAADGIDRSGKAEDGIKDRPVPLSNAGADLSPWLWLLLIPAAALAIGLLLLLYKRRKKKEKAEPNGESA